MDEATKWFIWETEKKPTVCEVCASLNGKIFSSDDAPSFPPHPNCKCKLKELKFMPSGDLSERQKLKRDQAIDEADEYIRQNNLDLNADDRRAIYELFAVIAFAKVGADSEVIWNARQQIGRVTDQAKLASKTVENRTAANLKAMTDDIAQMSTLSSKKSSSKEEKKNSEININLNPFSFFGLKLLRYDAYDSFTQNTLYLVSTALIELKYMKADDGFENSVLLNGLNAYKDANMPDKNKDKNCGVLDMDTFRRLMEDYKKASDKKQEAHKDNGKEKVKEDDQAISKKGIDKLMNFELSSGYAKSCNIGAFNSNGEMTGVYPHYVFKGDGKGGYISDGGITLGYGVWVSKKLYDSDSELRAIVDKYAPNASFKPGYTPESGRSYKVSGSKPMPIKEARALFSEKVKVYEKPLNEFLDTYGITLKPNQFDAMTIFTYQLGQNSWSEKPNGNGGIKGWQSAINFLKGGNYDEDTMIGAFKTYKNSMGEDRYNAVIRLFTKGYDD